MKKLASSLVSQYSNQTSVDLCSISVNSLVEHEPTNQLLLRHVYLCQGYTEAEYLLPCLYT